MAELRKTETGKILCLENTGPVRDLAGLFPQLEAYLGERNVSAKGDRLCIWYEDPLSADWERAHTAAALELAGEITGDGEVTVVLQPAGWVACETFEGPHTGLREAYRTLLQWVQEQGYRAAGSVREYYLRGGGPGSGDETQALTEIQLPVEKAGA